MGREGADSGELDRLRDVLRRARFFLRRYACFAKTDLRDELATQVESLEAAMSDKMPEKAWRIAAAICRTLLVGSSVACVLFAAERSVAARDPELGYAIQRQAARLRAQYLDDDPGQTITQIVLRTVLNLALAKHELDYRNIRELIPDAQLDHDVNLLRLILRRVAKSGLEEQDTSGFLEFFLTEGDLRESRTPAEPPVSQILRAIAPRTDDRRAGGYSNVHGGQFLLESLFKTGPLWLHGRRRELLRSRTEKARWIPWETVTESRRNLILRVNATMPERSREEGQPRASAGSFWRGTSTDQALPLLELGSPKPRTKYLLRLINKDLAIKEVESSWEMGEPSIESAEEAASLSEVREAFLQSDQLPRLRLLHVFDRARPDEGSAHPTRLLPDALASRSGSGAETPSGERPKQKVGIPRRRSWKRSAQRATKSVSMRGRRSSTAMRSRTKHLISTASAKSRSAIGTMRSWARWLREVVWRCCAFISYRRDGSWEAAQLIRLVLELHQIHVFLDVVCPCPGPFPATLDSEITHANGVIVVLTRRCLASGRRGQNDHFHREIVQAESRGKKVIPVMFRDFKYPSRMPGPLGFLKLNQDVRWGWTREGFCDAVEKLIHLVSGKQVEAMNLGTHQFAPYPASAPGAYIAYARDKGEEVAWILRLEFARRSIPAYLDLSDLTLGLEEPQIRDAINAHPYFVLILNRGECLERLRQKHSRLRTQLEYALKANREIVPFVFEDLDLSRIPKKLRMVGRYFPVSYTVESFAKAVEQLIRSVDSH